MYLIDASYFTRELSIPNVNEANSSEAGVLTQFIDDKVRLLLQYALGYDLFTELDENITNGVLHNDAPQIWKNLVNGKIYTKNDKSYCWQGLAYTNGAFKVSLLANYVYHEYLQYQYSQLTGAGEVSIQVKNAIGINSNQRLTKVWNEFVEMYQGYNFGHNGLVYMHNGVAVRDYFNGFDNSQYVSLITFLQDNDGDYPDANLGLFKVKNQLGL